MLNESSTKQERDKEVIQAGRSSKMELKGQNGILDLSNLKPDDLHKEMGGYPNLHDEDSEVSVNSLILR